jgi:hypothetical protein
MHAAFGLSLFHFGRRNAITVNESFFSGAKRSLSHQDDNDRDE